MKLNLTTILILSLITIIFIAGCGQQQEPTTIETTSIQPSLAVSDQSLTDNEVVIDSLYLDKSGYVVIHKEDNGKPGAVIGHSDLVSGENNNLKVEIDSSQAGSKIFAMLHYDDNDDGVYGFPDEDKPVVLEGNVVVKPIVITSEMEETTMTSNTVDITSSSFSPKTLTITAGETVKFTNKDSRSSWPASAVHPTHTVYPETGGCIGSKFDACKGLAQDESYSFTFNEKGTWNYHDHSKPGMTGTIIVE